VLIGAFANEANVKNIKAKLAEQGIKTFSEPLDTPQGKKTRVGPVPLPVVMRPTRRWRKCSASASPESLRRSHDRV
jgi:hypothetical protein